MNNPAPISPHWPRYLPTALVKPDTTLFANLQVAALRFGGRTAIGFMGRDISYGELLAGSERFAAWLQGAGVVAESRVVVFMQNAPQWLFAYYGILRTDPVVVSVNPMNKADELRKLIEDSGATVLVCSSELAQVAVAAAEGTSIRSIIAAAYNEYLPATPAFELPAWMVDDIDLPAGVLRWSEVLESGNAVLSEAPAPLRHPHQAQTHRLGNGLVGRC